MNKHKKFIKEAYEGKHGRICQEWKDTILRHYPEFSEQEFKVGDWVVCEKGYANNSFKRGMVGRLSKIHENGSIKYAVNQNEKLRFKDFNWCVSVRKATKEEIEQHLIKEAERRGFKKGCIHTIANGDAIIDLTGKESQYLIYDSLNDKLLFNGWCIYEKGQWAEIIPTMTKEEAERKLNCKIV